MKRSKAVKVYELESLKMLTNADLKREAGVVAIEDIDLREVMNLVSSGQYASFDEVVITKQTPDDLLEKFSKEHLHEDDEVRYILSGYSIFDVRGSEDQWIRIEVSEKDFISVPARLYHRFFVPSKETKALRLFSDKEGWVPIYRETAGIVAEAEMV